jgi:hypothetical protein
VGSETRPTPEPGTIGAIFYSHIRQHGSLSRFIVMLALAWALGGEVGMIPDEYRTRVRDIVDDEMDAVIETMEEDGMAGLRRMFVLN